MGEPPPVHKWFEIAAEQGDLVAAFNYAVCLAEGVGVPRDDVRAAFWLKRAADDLVSAQYWYGRMLAEGRGVPRDDAEAITWFARAAEAGLVEAQVALAERHLNGLGTPRNPQLAKAWLLQAAAEHTGAMFALGALHADGQDIETDHEEARRWFVRAAKREHPLAALMIARYAVRGLGGPQDIDVGRRWYEHAALLGVPEAMGELSTLNEELAKHPAQISQTELGLDSDVARHPP
jgi:TPR repeat protein